MDNKITRRRLSDFLSYEWILMIVIVVAAIIVWEFAYTVGAVRLTTGQHFKFYYDQTISSSDNDKMYDLFNKYDTFSYDVLKLDSESLTSEYNVMSVRLSVQEGDILITDKKQTMKDDGNGGQEVDESKSVRAKSHVDNYSMYALDDMLFDAQKYLAQFLNDGLDVLDSEGKYDLNKIVNYIYDFNNYSDAKIRSYFLRRMKDDNRFRSDEQKANGFNLEKDRIKDLTKEVKLFDEFIKYANANPELGLLFNYRKYEQSYKLTTDQENKARYETMMNNQQVKPYAINVEAFTGICAGTTEPSTFLRMKGADSAKDVVIMAFDFYSYQPHLQFETISFMNTIIRECFNTSLLGI